MLIKIGLRKTKCYKILFSKVKQIFLIVIIGPFFLWHIFDSYQRPTGYTNTTSLMVILIINCLLLIDVGAKFYLLSNNNQIFILFLIRNQILITNLYVKKKTI